MNQTYVELRNAVILMRNVQKEYFRVRNYNCLMLAKTTEDQVDRILRIIQEAEDAQPSLFREDAV
jgi:hypothetical protein